MIFSRLRKKLTKIGILVLIKATKRRGEFGRRIAALRANKALTASDLARLTDVTPAAVWQWEKNGTQPRRHVIEKIAKHFGLPVSELTGRPDEASSIALQYQAKTLTDYSLEDLLRAIEARGFHVTLRRNVG